MKRKIIIIDENLCNGCGQCVLACAEGAIELVNGKAKLVKEQFCDGFGDCVGECPQDALFIEEQEVEAFDPEATKHHLFQTKGAEAVTHMEEAHARHAASAGGCPGSKFAQFDKPPASAGPGQVPSQLTHWPIQMSLVSPNMPVFKNADLLLAADCTAFAYGNFHSEFLTGKALIIGCPKLDDTDPYLAKLVEIIKANDLKSLTVVHMEVPCCHGLVRLAQEALKQTGSDLGLQTVTVGVNGQLK